MKAVAFDLWETLITDTPELARAQERLRLDGMETVLRESGHAAEANAIERAYRALWKRCNDLYWSADRDISTRQQLVHFFEALGVGADGLSAEMLGRLEHAYIQPALDVPPQLVEGARETVQRLKRDGHAIGLISNTGRTPGSVLRRVLLDLGVGDSIDAMVFSNEHGLCKPESSIFAELCRLLELPPSEVVFVGDNVYCDVHGAQKAGMKGVLFTPAQRGTAVGPAIDHGLTISPDASIRQLTELPDVIARLSA